VCQGLEDTKKRFLRDVLRIRTIAEHSSREAKTRRGVPIDQRCECSILAVQRTLYELLVRQPNRLYPGSGRFCHTWNRFRRQCRFTQ
jgi:hypothetical protein